MESYIIECYYTLWWTIKRWQYLVSSAHPLTYGSRWRQCYMVIYPTVQPETTTFALISRFRLTEIKRHLQRPKHMVLGHKRILVYLEPRHGVLYTVNRWHCFMKSGTRHFASTETLWTTKGKWCKVFVQVGHVLRFSRFNIIRVRISN